MQSGVRAVHVKCLRSALSPSLLGPANHRRMASSHSSAVPLQGASDRAAGRGYGPAMGKALSVRRRAVYLALGRLKQKPWVRQGPERPRNSRHRPLESHCFDAICDACDQGFPPRGICLSKRGFDPTSTPYFCKSLISYELRRNSRRRGTTLGAAAAFSDGYR
jgi:hypothetical protein